MLVFADDTVIDRGLSDGIFRTAWAWSSPGWQNQAPVNAASLELLHDRTLAAPGPDRLESTDLLCMP